MDLLVFLNKLLQSIYICFELETKSVIIDASARNKYRLFRNENQDITQCCFYMINKYALFVNEEK